MSQARILGIVGVVALAAAAVAYAQTTVTPVPNNAPVQQAPLNTAPEKTVWGDAKAGATKAGTCAACHGLDGNPTDPQYPRLAGQSERYIANQIHLFKTGERNTGMAAVMKPFADALSAQDARDIGAYFATQKAGAGVADDTAVATGANAGKKLTSRSASSCSVRATRRAASRRAWRATARTAPATPARPTRTSPASRRRTRSAAWRNTAPARPFSATRTCSTSWPPSPSS